MRAWHSGAFIVPRQDRSTVVAHRSLAVPASCVMDLDLIERYYDAAPRAAADVEEIGPFTLFVADPATGWSFYARPRPGAAADGTPDEFAGCWLARPSCGCRGPWGGSTRSALAAPGRPRRRANPRRAGAVPAPGASRGRRAAARQPV